MLFRYLSNYYCYILLVLLFQVAGRELILLLQRCRRPAVSDDVEGTAADEDSDDDEDDDNLMFHAPVAPVAPVAPNPPVVAAPGIRISISNSVYFFIHWFYRQERQEAPWWCEVQYPRSSRPYSHQVSPGVSGLLNYLDNV